MPTHFKNLSGTMKVLRLLAISMMLVFSMVTLGLAIHTNKNLNENITIVKDTIKNWQTPSILDLQVVQTSQRCPDGYERLYKYIWGSYDGCDCINSTSSEFQSLGMHQPKCNETELWNGCTDIIGQSQVELVGWGLVGNVSNGFCIKRTNETWANIGPTQGTSCPNNKLKCGTSDDNVFCTNETNCPITSITFSNSSCANCIKFDDMRYIKVGRGEDTLPLAEVRLNEFGMCYEVDERARSPGRKVFPLLYDSYSDCLGEGNALWNIFDTWREDKLFEINNITASVNYLSLYGFYQSGKSGSDYEWHVFNRGYVPWKFHCRYMMQDIIDKSGNLDEVKSTHAVMLGVTIASTIIVGVMLTVMEVLNLCGVDLPCIKGKEEEERQKLLKIKSRVQCTMKLILLPFQVWAIVVLIKIKHIVRYASDNNCSSKTMNDLIEGASDSLEKAFISDLLAIIVLVIFFIGGLIHAHHEKKKLAKEQEVARVSTLDNLQPSNNNDTIQNINDTSINTSLQNQSNMQLKISKAEQQIEAFNRLKNANNQNVNTGQQQIGQPQFGMPGTLNQFQSQPIQNPGINLGPNIQQNYQPMNMQNNLQNQMGGQNFMGYLQNQPQAFNYNQQFHPQIQPQFQPQGQPQGQQIFINFGG
jgi:hypothetical protein